MLSPQHLALARSLPHSGASTPTPSLLTPPVSGTPNMSPPPRREAEDYMNVRVPDHHGGKRKHPRERIRKLYNTREGSEGSRPPRRSLRFGPQNASSDGSCCETCSTGVSDGDEDSDSHTPLIKSLGQPDSRSHLHGPRNIKEVDENHVQTWPTLSSSAVAVEEPDSPAVNALQSLSFRVPIRSNSHGLQRMSTALVNTFSLLRPNPAVSFDAVPSRKASKKAEEASRRNSAHTKSLAYGNMNRRRPTFKDGKDVSRTLGTPATITLRKASNVYAISPVTTSMSASLTREREHKPAADAPASELLAFYSSRTLDKRPILTEIPSPESVEAPRILKEQPTFTLETESQSFRRVSKSVSQFSDISNARLCSIPAEAALTFADVHVAPGSFAVGPNSRTQSLVLAECSRRISTVQVWSRSSVHEVIWREDETMSGSSPTASSGASQYVGHSFRSTPSPDSEGNLTQEPAIETEETEAALPTVSDSVSMFTKMPDHLFRWTWGVSSGSPESTPRAVDPKSDPLDQAAEVAARAAEMKDDPLGQKLVNSTSDPVSGSPTQSSDHRDSRSHKPSIFELSSVQSFPPLRSRSSTAEWRRAPLVDLQDPLAGRVTQYNVQRSSHCAGLGTNVGSCVAEGKERRSSELYDTASGRRWSSGSQANTRLGLFGSVGSGVGASSRKRILSRRKF